MSSRSVLFLYSYMDRRPSSPMMLMVSNEVDEGGAMTGT